MSSTTPTIILDSSGGVKMVAGASGGWKITSSVAQVKQYSSYIQYVIHIDIFILSSQPSTSSIIVIIT